MAVKMGSFPVIRELPEGYYSVIGRIIVDWSYLETQLHDCTYMLLRVSRKEGRIAVRSPRASEIVSMIEELMEYNSFSTKVKTKELKKALIKIGGARDALAHGVWVDFDNEDSPVLQVRSGSFAIEPGAPAVKARINPVAMVATPEELQLTVQDIKSATEAVARLRNEIETQAGSLPEKPRRQ